MSKDKEYIKQLEEANSKLREMIEAFRVREERLDNFEKNIRWVDYSESGVSTPRKLSLVSAFYMWDKPVYKIIRNENEQYSCYCYIGESQCIFEKSKYLQDAKLLCQNHLKGTKLNYE
jgi:hypothetical protein